MVGSKPTEPAKAAESSPTQRGAVPIWAVVLTILIALTLFAYENQEITLRVLDANFPQVSQKLAAILSPHHPTMGALSALKVVSEGYGKKYGYNEGQLNAIQALREYLRIRTDHPKPDYERAVRWIVDYCRSVPGAKVGAYPFVPSKPVVLCTWMGTAKGLPSIMVNSHYDVVPPGNLSAWSVSSPFQADLNEEQNRIYARGIQDMKSVGIQYIEAIKAMVAGGKTLKRSLHVVWVPDEEIGGLDGMGMFVQSKLFEALTIGVQLDEGLASPGEEFEMCYGERRPFWTVIDVKDLPGHGATLPSSSATLTLTSILAKVAAFRAEQAVKLASDGLLLGDILSVNIVHLQAGVHNANNVIPPTAKAILDIRVPPTVTSEEVDELIESWIRCDNGDRCPGVSVSFNHRAEVSKVTSMDEKENPWAGVFRKATKNIKLHPMIFPASTDARFLRNMGIPCFGFSPMNGTAVLLHKDDEYLDVEVFLRGIRIYEDILFTMANEPLLPGEAVANSQEDL